MNGIFKKVLVSEKSFQDASVGKYTFVVDPSADKTTIAKMCEKLFKVTVLSVNSMNYSGKIKMVKRIKGKRNNFKKVVLTLKKGDKIDLFEIENEEAPKLEDKKSAKAKKTKEEKTVENKDVEVTIKSKK